MKSQQQHDILPVEKVIDDITLHKAKKGDIGACFDVGDAYYHYYRDTPKSSVDVLHHAEKWFTKGLNLGSAAGFYPLGLVYMEYADALSETEKNIKQKLSYLLQAEYLFLKAFHETEDTDACYQLGKLYFDHADVLEFNMETTPHCKIANDDMSFIKKQRRKKLESAEKYFLLAITRGTRKPELVHYMLGILYWQYAIDANKKEKPKCVENAQFHFNYTLHLQPRIAIWTICRLFLSIGEYKVALKYFLRIFIG